MPLSLLFDMEEVLGSRRSIARESSPDRAKVVYKKIPVIKKVQVVYYLTRNGHLEHPHYMEVSHLSNQPLRLKDVIDRLVVLRGKTIPSLYSWSCKRSYKNGYVWNDLTDNDVIYPSDNGAEYVLKGSELIDHQLCSEKLQQLQLSHSRLKMNNQEQNSKASQIEEEEEDEQESCEDEDQKSTGSTTPHSRCSRGVSTDDPLAVSRVQGLRKEIADADEIKCMSENPRFGNLQATEKEYFSGSIVQSITVESSLKKSNSYNEQRRRKDGLEEEDEVVVERKSNNGVKGKCIPRRKFVLSSKKKTKK